MNLNLEKIHININIKLKLCKRRFNFPILEDVARHKILIFIIVFKYYFRKLTTHVPLLQTISLLSFSEIQILQWRNKSIKIAILTEFKSEIFPNI